MTTELFLSNVRKNSRFRIKKISDEFLKSYLIRFGISEGTIVKCQEKLPFGPVVVQLNRQEIAIGRKFADIIEIELE